MKTLLSLLIIFSTLSLLRAQIVPQNSPYYNYGSYTVVADSDMTISPKIVSYRPNSNAGGPYPVFIFQLGANGFGSTAINTHSYDIYLKHLASWGYVVIIVSDTQAGIPNGTSFTTVHNWYKTKYAYTNHWMQQYADSSKVIIGGHSNGGVNATALLINRPSEIDAIVYFASHPSSFFPTHDVSGYTGKVLDLAGTEDSFSTSSSCKAGYNKFTSSSCKVWALIQGLNHGGFGDYNYSSQPVGSIGRDSATATIRHYLLSFLEGQFKNSTTGYAGIFNQSNRPNTTNEFLSTCQTNSLNEMSDENMEVYPNPSTNYVTIKTANYVGPVKVKLVNSLGQIVYSEEAIGISEKTISLSDLPVGIYVVSISYQNKLLTKKVIRN